MQIVKICVIFINKWSKVSMSVHFFNVIQGCDSLQKNVERFQDYHDLPSYKWFLLDISCFKASTKLNHKFKNLQ